MNKFYCVCQSKKGRTGLCDILPEYQKELADTREELALYKKAYELMARDFALKNHCSSIKECSDCLVNDECHSAEWLMEYYKCLVF